jgi:hypothetical protein
MAPQETPPLSTNNAALDLTEIDLFIPTQSIVTAWTPGTTWTGTPNIGLQPSAPNSGYSELIPCQTGDTFYWYGLPDDILVTDPAFFLGRMYLAVNSEWSRFNNPNTPGTQISKIGPKLFSYTITNSVTRVGLAVLTEYAPLLTIWTSNTVITDKVILPPYLGRAMTLAAYNALPDSQKNNGLPYFIIE